MRCIDDVLVGFVGDDKAIVFFSETQDGEQFVAREHLARGVAGVAEHDRFWLLCEGAFQFVFVKAEMRRMERHVDRLGARENRIGCVVLVEGRKDDDLISRIARRHHRDHHRLGAAAGDHEMPIRIDVESGEVRDLARQRLTKARSAPRHGILMKRTARGALQGSQNLLRRIEIRKALREVDRAVLIGHTRCAADDGFAEDGKAAGCSWHDRGKYGGAILCA